MTGPRTAWREMWAAHWTARAHALAHEAAHLDELIDHYADADAALFATKQSALARRRAAIEARMREACERAGIADVPVTGRPEPARALG